MRKEKRKEKIKQIKAGSLTVEAALVMPIIVYIILLMVIFMLYMYNRSVMEDAAILAVKQVVYYEEDKTNSEMVRIVKEKCEESLKERLIGMDKVTVDVSVGKMQSRVKLKGRLVIAGSGIMGYSVPFETIEVSAKSDRLRPGQFIRTVRKGKKIKDWITERNKETDEGTVQEGHES